MLAVSNTSPISNLASINRLDLLRLQFDTVWIPEAVAKELKAHPAPAALSAIQSAIHEGWLQIGCAVDSALLRVLESQLHAGEAEAIALAIEKTAQVVLLDEKEGRSMATRCGLSVTGVLGILLKAKRMGQIPEVRSEIDSLRRHAGFYVAAVLEASVLFEAGEAT
jgi:uncharacterized protein